ncbi:MAG: hypothetical protein ABMA25_21365 [Ilumatobacteraceae bacterium]
MSTDEPSVPDGIPRLPPRPTSTPPGALGPQRPQPYLPPASVAPAAPAPVPTVAPTAPVGAAPQRPPAQRPMAPRPGAPAPNPAMASMMEAAAAEAPRAKPRQRSRRDRQMAPALFLAGLAALLWSTFTAIDESGPTVERSAMVTDLVMRTYANRATEYEIVGVDVEDGEFRTSTVESVYRAAALGDRVVVTRAWLTGRVTAIAGPGWDVGRPQRLWVYLAAAVVGLGLLAWGIRQLRREAAEIPGTPAPFRRIRWWLLVVAVLFAGWIVLERTSANADGSLPPPVVVQ